MFLPLRISIVEGNHCSPGSSKSLTSRIPCTMSSHFPGFHRSSLLIRLKLNFPALACSSAASRSFLLASRIWSLAACRCSKTAVSAALLSEPGIALSTLDAREEVRAISAGAAAAVAILLYFLLRIAASALIARKVEPKRPGVYHSLNCPSFLTGLSSRGGLMTHLLLAQPKLLYKDLSQLYCPTSTNFLSTHLQETTPRISSPLLIPIKQLLAIWPSWINLLIISLAFHLHQTSQSPNSTSRSRITSRC